jgi:hypothetical protein
MLGAMAIQCSMGEEATHKRLYCGYAGTASQERLNLKAFGMVQTRHFGPFPASLVCMIHYYRTAGHYRNPA